MENIDIQLKILFHSSLYSLDFFEHYNTPMGRPAAYEAVCQALGFSLSTLSTQFPKRGGEDYPMPFSSTYFFVIVI